MSLQAQKRVIFDLKDEIIAKDKRNAKLDNELRNLRNDIIELRKENTTQRKTIEDKNIIISKHKELNTKLVKEFEICEKQCETYKREITKLNKEKGVNVNA